MAGQNRWRHPTAPGRVMVGGGGEWSQDFAQPGDESLPEMPKEVLWAISNAVGDRESMGGPMKVEQPAPPEHWEPPNFAPEVKSVNVVASQPVIQSRTPAARIDARPAPVLSPEEREAKAAEMVASLNRPGEGQTAATMGRPPGVMGLAAQAAASTAQGVAGGRGGAPAPAGDPQMDRAKLLSAASGVEARLSGAADPLKAALLGRRDDGSGRREAIANAERTDPVAGLTAERKVQAELQMQRDRLNPNSEHSRRIRDLMAGGDPVKAKAMEGASAADLEKFAPLLVKQIEAQMAREAREGAREDQQNFQAQQNALARQQSGANAQMMAGFRGQQFLDKRLDRFGDEANKVQPVVTNLAQLDELLGGFGGKSDVPGVGGTAFLPNILLSSEGKAVRGAAADLSANVLRAFSGAAASDREMMRTLNRLGQGDFSSDEDFRNALGRVKQWVGDQLRNSEAAVGPEVVDTFRQRGGTTSATVGNIGGAPAQGAAPSGPVRVTNGTETLEIDAADLADAERDGYRVAE